MPSFEALWKCFMCNILPSIDVNSKFPTQPIEICHILSTYMAGTPLQIWARQGPIFYPFFLTVCFSKESIETQNLVKAQALGALPAVAALWEVHIILSYGVYNRTGTPICNLGRYCHFLNMKY